MLRRVFSSTINVSLAASRKKLVASSFSTSSIAFQKYDDYDDRDHAPNRENNAGGNDRAVGGGGGYRRPGGYNDNFADDDFGMRRPPPRQMGYGQRDNYGGGYGGPPRDYYGGGGGGYGRRDNYGSGFGNRGAGFVGSAEFNERNQRSVYVGNIPWNSNEEDLKNFFSKAGVVQRFRIVYDRESGQSRGFGFCEYADVETANKASEQMNGSEYNGRTLRVNAAGGGAGARTAERPVE